MIINEKKWNSYVKKNKEPYGKCCVDVARKTMELLDDDNHKDFDSDEIIIEAEHKLMEEKKIKETEGITGFMAGCIAQMIKECHSRGEEFKKKWNAHWGITEKGKNYKEAINPALMTINIKE